MILRKKPLHPPQKCLNIGVDTVFQALSTSNNVPFPAACYVGLVYCCSLFNYFSLHKIFSFSLNFSFTWPSSLHWSFVHLNLYSFPYLAHVSLLLSLLSLLLHLKSLIAGVYIIWSYMIFLLIFGKRTITWRSFSIKSLKNLINLHDFQCLEPNCKGSVLCTGVTCSYFLTFADAGIMKLNMRFFTEVKITLSAQTQEYMILVICGLCFW